MNPYQLRLMLLSNHPDGFPREWKIIDLHRSIKAYERYPRNNLPEVKAEMLRNLGDVCPN